MDLRLLGPFEVRASGDPVEIRGWRQRAVLSALALEANQVVTVGHLVSAAWDDPPQSAEANIRNHVMALRRLLEAASEPERLVTRPNGYLLRAESGELDAALFEALVADGERALGEGATATAAMSFDRACRLWRGPALDGVPLAGPLQAAAQRLTERRLMVVERWAGARLDLGQHVELIDELAGLASMHPLRESLWEQLMVALYRSGRQADALAAYDRVRHVLVDELGIDPNPRLQRLRQRILQADPALQLGGRPDHDTVPPAPVPRQLPPTVPAFTGRVSELNRLAALLSAGGVESSAENGHVGSADTGEAVVSAITGGAGVGKTALAVQFAHRAAGRFTGGQLYVDLRGYDPHHPPLPPSEVLGQFLRALGLDPKTIPTSLDEQTALYRSVAAGRRLLVVLDNAADPQQVRPLLPGSASCMVVVTSRSRLSGLVARDGATRITLDVLSPEQATKLLVRILGSQRVTAEPEAATDLTRLCGYLPLALRIAAEQLATDAHAALAALVGELAAEHRRLDVLTAANDDTTTVRAALRLSYRRLPPAAARLFRLLGLHAGSGVGIHAAAALADISAERVRPLLHTLAEVHLLEAGTSERYRMHDLVRLYAREQAGSQERDGDREAAIGRLLAWYLHTADAADHMIFPHRPRLPLDGFHGRCPPLTFERSDQAVRWCETERANVVAATRQAAETGHHTVAWQLPIALWGFFKLRKYWGDWIATHRIALAAAQHTHDHRGHRWTLGCLGYAYTDLHRFHDARDCLRRALAMCQEVDDRWGQATAMTGLGLAHRDHGQLERARDYLHHALAECHGIDDRWGRAVTLTGLGLTYQSLRRFDQAQDFLQRALASYRNLDDPWGQAWALHSLGPAPLISDREPTKVP